MAADGYRRISIPEELVTEIEDLIRTNKKGFRSVSEFIKDAIRKNLDTMDFTEKDKELLRLIREKNSKPK